MFVVSLAAGLVPFDPARVLALRALHEVVFKRAVRFGDAIHVVGKVEALRPAGEDAGLVTLAWRILDAEERLVCRARVDVLWKAELMARRLLITGVVNKHSIAWEVARQAIEAGDEVVLTGFGRARRMTERAAAQLPGPVDVLELDVNEPADLAALAVSLQERWGALDGVLHAIAFAPATRSAARSWTRPSRAPRRRSPPARSR